MKNCCLKGFHENCLGFAAPAGQYRAHNPDNLKQTTLLPHVAQIPQHVLQQMYAGEWHWNKLNNLKPFPVYLLHHRGKQVDTWPGLLPFICLVCHSFYLGLLEKNMFLNKSFCIPSIKQWGLNRNVLVCLYVHLYTYFLFLFSRQWNRL